MKNIEKVKLNPSEASAYYWINLVQEKSDDLEFEKEKLGYNEQVFYDLFKNYKDEDWRKVYLFLVKNIEKGVSELNPPKRGFVQRTNKGKHNEVNKALEMAADVSVPDISLSQEYQQEIATLTTPTTATEMIKDISSRNLETEYGPTYIIDGDKEKLDFYKTLIATLYILEHHDSDFDSKKMFDERYCEVYMKDHDILDSERETIMENVKYYFELARSRGLVASDKYCAIFRTTMRQKDLVGLDNHFGKAIDYAKSIVNPPEIPMKKEKKRNG